MSKQNKMNCPDCGVEMNHHADKIEYTSEPEQDEAADAVLGGIIEEAHTCPDCGKTILRKQPE